MALRLIAYNCDNIDGLTVIRNSEGDYVASNDPAELLDFIGEDFSDEERKEPYRELKVAWDIDQLCFDLQVTEVNNLTGEIRD